MTELSLHILDISKNSTKAGATLVEITVAEDIADNLLTIENPPGFLFRGCGGLSLFKSACVQTGGDLVIASRVGEGTKVTATFVYDSIDRQPIGDMASTIAALVGGNVKTDFVYTHKYNTREFVFSTIEIRKILGDEVELSNLEVLDWIEGYINEQIQKLYGGAL